MFNWLDKIESQFFPEGTINAPTIMSCYASSITNNNHKERFISRKPKVLFYQWRVTRTNGWRVPCAIASRLLILTTYTYLDHIISSLLETYHHLMSKLLFWRSKTFKILTHGTSLFSVVEFNSSSSAEEELYHIQASWEGLRLWCRS